MYDIEKKITDAIEIMVKKYMSDLVLTPRPRGKVTVVTTGTPNTYTVVYNSQTLTGIKARAGVTPAVNNVVYLIIPNGILSDVFIDCIVP